MVKKPTPKVSGKTASAKPTAKAGGKPAAKGKTEKPAKGEFAVGEKVMFLDYAEEMADDEKVFEPNTEVVIVAKEQRDKKTIYTVVAPEDVETYEKEPDEVDGSEVVASELKKIKAGAVAKVKEAPKPQEVKAFGDLGKILKKGNLVEQAVTLLDDGKKAFFYFGGVLAEIYNKNLEAPKGVTWIDGKEGREAWDKFCSEKFGMGAGAVRGFMDTYQTLSQIKGVDIKRVSEIGWSKMAEVSRYITNDNAEELLDKAEELSTIELKSTLKTEYVDAEGKTPSGRQTRGAGKLSKTSYAFQLYEDKAAAVNYILDAAKKQLGLEDLNDVFEHIISEWATDHLDESKVAKAQAASNKVLKDAKKAGVAIPERKKVKEAA